MKKREGQIKEKTKKLKIWNNIQASSRLGNKEVEDLNPVLRPPPQKHRRENLKTEFKPHLGLTLIP